MGSNAKIRDVTRTTSTDRLKTEEVCRIFFVSSKRAQHGFRGTQLHVHKYTPDPVPDPRASCRTHSNLQRLNIPVHNFYFSFSIIFGCSFFKIRPSEKSVTCPMNNCILATLSPTAKGNRFVPNVCRTLTEAKVPLQNKAK